MEEKELGVGKRYWITKFFFFLLESNEMFPTTYFMAVVGFRRRYDVGVRLHRDFFPTISFRRRIRIEVRYMNHQTRWTSLSTGLHV